ncbi:hypothetical protein ACJ2A9_21480 [Anaerobacillus sp. MEB173]|uniref:hypothetical protein n=1 Tax=Anaerobacillus sp. MEB173 TaxID=3383345 RepID=UPI003F91C52C
MRVLPDVMITIPHQYQCLANGNKELFIGYVKGFIRKNHPELRPKQIRGIYVICERDEEFEERKAIKQKTKSASSRKRTKSK